MSGAPLGNSNSADGKAFNRALRRALARKSNESVDAGLEQIAARLVDAAYESEQWAVKEVADRIDGKSAQIVAGSADLPPVSVRGFLEFIKPA